MQFVCVTFFYISVFYRYKKHLHTKLPHPKDITYSEKLGL